MTAQLTGATPAPPTAATQPALGHAILAAALLLPGVGVAHAGTPPDRAALSIRYADYEESQPGLDRIHVASPSIALVTPLAGAWSLSGTLTADGVSGASPRYHSAVSGASRMTDRRRAADLSVTRYFARGSLTVGGASSSERDYVSRAASLLGTVASDDQNTEWFLGLGGANDSINPVNHVVTGESRQTLDFMAGITQVLGTRDLAQLTLTHNHGHGYFSDPYKSLDKRPRARDQDTLLVRWNHHLGDSDATARLSYRFYSDSYAIRAHTLGAELVQDLGRGWSVTPSARLYSQRAARFYYDPVYDARLGAPFPPGYSLGANQYLSPDQRLSAFGAITFGVRLARQLGRDWSVDLKLETYGQRAGWRLFGSGSPGLEPLRARTFQLGVTRLW